MSDYSFKTSLQHTTQVIRLKHVLDFTKPSAYLQFVDDQVVFLTDVPDGLRESLVLNVLELDAWEHVPHQRIKPVDKCT